MWLIAISLEERVVRLSLTLLTLLVLSAGAVFASATETVLLSHDTGVVNGAYDGLNGRRSLAVKLELPATSKPIRLDFIQIYMAPQGENNMARLFLRLESNQNNAPGATPPLHTWRTSLSLSQAAWYTLPVYHLLESGDQSIILSFKSEDFPWAPAPLIMLDDGRNIPAGHNYYGQNFSDWMEHYQFWADPAMVGNLMVRAQITIGDDALTTTTPTPTPTSTPTRTPTRTPTPSSTPTLTRTPSPTPTLTRTPTRTLTRTPTPTLTRTLTPTLTLTPPPAPSITPTATPRPDPFPYQLWLPAVSWSR